MSKNLESALTTVKNLGNKTILSENIVMRGSLFKKERIIVLSDFGVHILKNNGIKIENYFTWFDIINYSIDKNVITIKISQKNQTFTFEIEEKSKIFQTVEDILQKLLLPSELHDLNPKLHSNPTPRSAFYRTVKFHQKIVPKINSIIRFSNDSVTLKDSNIADYCDIVPLITTITSVTVSLPIEKKANLETLINYLSFESNLLHIYFKGDINAQFQSIARALTENKQTKVKALSFKNSNFNEASFSILSMLCNTLDINSLAFHNSFKPSAFFHFYNKFIPSLRITPHFISMNESSNIALQSIITSKTVVLSLESCSLEISTILGYIAANAKNLTSLRTLNIGNNVCSKSFTKTLQLPAGIRSIFASGIQWRGPYLRTFFEVLFNNFDQGLRLSFAHADATQDDWRNLNDFLSDTTFKSLTALNWSGNPITAQLVSFLGRNKKLSVLEISECLSEDFPNNVRLFCSFLEGAKQLERFIMRGSEAKNIGNMFGYMLKVIAKNKSIIDIDLSNNYGGNEALDQIKVFANSANNSCKANFDGTFPTDLKKLQDTIEAVLEAGKHKIKLSFPSDDLRSFIGNDFDERQYLLIMKKFATTYTRNAEVDAFDGPFRVPKNIYTSDFPEYISTEDLIQLVSSVALINKNSPRPRNMQKGADVSKSAEKRRPSPIKATPAPVVEFNERKPQERRSASVKKRTEEPKPSSPIDRIKRHSPTKIDDTIKPNENAFASRRPHHEQQAKVVPLRKKHSKRSEEPKTLDATELGDDIIDCAISSIFGDSAAPSRMRRRVKISDVSNTMIPDDDNDAAFNPESSLRKRKHKTPDAKKETNENNEDITPLRKRVKRRKVPQTLDGIEPMKERRAEPIFTEEQQNAKPKKRKHRTKEEKEHDTKWAMPVLTQYPIPSSIWSSLEDKFNADRMIEEIIQ